MAPLTLFDDKEDDGVNGDDHNDEDDDVESQDLLAPSQEQESQSSYSPSQHAQPFDAPSRSGFMSSPVEDNRRLSEFIFPAYDPSVVNSPLADRAIAYGDNDSDDSVRRSRRPSSRRSILLHDHHGDAGDDDDDDTDGEGDEYKVGNDDDEDEVVDNDTDDEWNDDNKVGRNDEDIDEDIDEDSEGTVIPGTAYDIITAAGRRNAVCRRIPASSISDMNPIYERWIRKAMLDDWGIQFPHEWQIRAIADIVFSRDTTTFLIAKTGSGKSAVPLTVGSLLTGVTLTMVPLVGLGSDQVNKCSNPDNFIEGYHLDEHRGSDSGLLRKRLLSLGEYEADNVAIFIYASPQSIDVGRDWHRTLMTLSSRNLIRLIVVDEAHSVAQDGRDFRPEFRTAVSALRKIYDNSPTPINFLAMSATFRRDDQDVISRLWTRPPDKVIWLELSRRGIGLDVVISGNPTSSIVKCMSSDYKIPTTTKTIVYTNSKRAAMGSLSKALEAMLEKCERNWRNSGYDFVPGRVISFTGDDGLQSKVHIMRAWARDLDDVPVHEDEFGDPGDELPNLLIMPATKAADCGVSSNSCRRSYRMGIASSLYSIVQEMGRVDRVPTGDDLDPTQNRYEVHLSFTCAVKLYARIMQHPEKSERELQLASFMEVLCFLVIPSECQHVHLERYFEAPDTTRLFESCRNCCPFCNRNRATTTGRINRQKLTRQLVGYCSSATPPTTGALIKFVKDRQRLFFHKHDQPKKGMGPIHALCLQLIASGILEFAIGDGSTKDIGKNDLNISNVVIKIGKDRGEPKAMFDTYWTNIQLSNDEIDE